MPSGSELITLWGYLFGGGTLRYLLAAGVLSLVLFGALRRWSLGRRTQVRRPQGRDVRREIAFSLSTTAVFAAVTVATYCLDRSGAVDIYVSNPRWSLAYELASLGVLLVLHDTYFYWMHRLMHHRRLFRFFHHVHHRSRTPTPWAAYAFAPAEAFVMSIYVPLFALCMPLSSEVIFAFMTFMIVRNAMGHSGIEFHPRWWIDSPLAFLGTVTHHDLHHQRVNGHYGLYFTWWDRLMGTEFPDYRERFLEAVEGAPAARAAERAGGAPDPWSATPLR